MVRTSRRFVAAETKWATAVQRGGVQPTGTPRALLLLRGADGRGLSDGATDRLDRPQRDRPELPGPPVIRPSDLSRRGRRRHAPAPCDRQRVRRPEPRDREPSAARSALTRFGTSRAERCWAGGLSQL